MFPRKYNPMRFVLKKRLKSQAVVDNTFGSPVGSIPQGEPIDLVGQVNMVNKPHFSLDPTKIGDAERSKGTILISKAHYTTAIEKGDRIIEFGPITRPTPINAMVIKVKGTAPLVGDFLFMVIEFEEDREGHST